ncbi:MAG: hypothetical protein R3293_10055 [Candidatus Promineifilaceae bacterium]|nr:hypothetical protein [Candidatus Promineifilaceae bacterium]
MVKLQVYINDDCWSCDESRRIVAEIVPQFPQITVELLDLGSSKLPEYIFAVPTFVLDGRVISLGNPHRDDLRRQIQNTLERHLM